MMITLTVLLYVGGIMIFWVKKKQERIRKIIELIPEESFEKYRSQQRNSVVIPAEKVSRLVKKSSLII